MIALLFLALSVSISAAAEPTFERHAFLLPEAIYAVDAIDVNGDGRLDLLAVSGSHVWAFLAPDWSRVELAHTPGGSTIHAVAIDCDGDGDRDLALGRASSDWIASRQAPKPVKVPEGADWTVAWIENTGRVKEPWPLHMLDRELHGVHGLWTGDVDNDGTADLLADSFAGPHFESSLAWFRAPKLGETATMARRIITHGKATGRPHYMDFADINHDGKGDVLLGASTEGSFTWWEQPADLNREWQRHVIAMEPGATHPRAVDLNGDGRLDVLASAGHGVGVAWYEALDWKKHVISDSVRDVHAFDAADLDGDGDIDCAGCSYSQKVVIWWENLGRGEFKAHDVDTAHEQEAYDLKLLDLDGDARRDILLAGRGSKNVVWYRNRQRE